MKNNFKTTDFPEGSKILFNDGEEWIVVKPGLRGSSNRLRSDEISAKPFNKLAKDRNISLSVDFSLNYLNDNVKKISESVDTTEEITEKRGNGEIAVLKSDKAKAEKIMKDMKIDYKDSGAKDSSSMNYFMIPNTDWDILNKIGSKVKLQSMTVRESTEEITEGREQIKRKYGEYSSIRVNETAPIRNEIVRFVGKRFVTEEEMKAFLTKLSEDRGKDLDGRQWFSRNGRYFEKFENRGQQVWTLSKFGKRTLEFINRPKEKTIINESIGLFKTPLFESINTKYWADYNTDTSGQSPKEFSEKSTDFEDTFEEAVVSWNREADRDNMIKGEQIKAIKKLAQEFFKKEKWISVNVIQAMISQES